MKRDMDLLREILFFAEENGKPVIGAQISHSQLKHCENDDILLGHINILVDQYYMKKPPHTMASYAVGDLTPAAYDFLDSVRDPEIWRQTKNAASKAGGWTIGLLGELAKGLAKTQIKKLTGVEL